MSRIGKQPVSVPSGVKVTLSGRTITIEGPKGTLSLEHRPEVKVSWDESEKSISVSIEEKHAGNREAKALWGTTRALINNMITGVTKGYSRKLEVNGVGWGGQVQGNQISLNLGFASPVKLVIPAGVTVTAEKQMLTLEGADKQLVMGFAARVRSVKKPEPYNGKGIKYTDEVIKRKQGKQFGS